MICFFFETEIRSGLSYLGLWIVTRITEPSCISLNLLEVIITLVTIRTEGVVYHRFKNISLST